MKTFLAEYLVNYSNYTFSYAKYAVREGLEDLTPFYDAGFLPYTGDLSIEPEIFYMARSLRVDLKNFEDTSENRRVLRTVEPLQIQIECIPKEDFNLEDEQFRSFCHSYIQERIGDDNMSIERWDYILSKPLGSHIFKFFNSKEVYGYVLAALNENLLHYWFAFFNTQYMRSHSLGKYMMWALIDWSRKNQLSYTYLGTAYKPSALYKIRDHKALEFFDGTTWNADIKILKDWCKMDEEELPSDRFKLHLNKSEYIHNL